MPCPPSASRIAFCESPFREFAFEKRNLISCDQSSPSAVSYCGWQPALEEAMQHFGELMQRLREIQSGGRQRSPKLIAEDERLMDGLQKRDLAGKPTQTVNRSPERARFQA
jgi:hypothetical protein